MPRCKCVLGAVITLAYAIHLEVESSLVGHRMQGVSLEGGNNYIV